MQDLTDPHELSPDEIDRHNGALGFRFVRALAVEKAALDRGLTPACVQVLAAISYFMNTATQRAWPSYARISEITGLSSDRIEKAIRLLKDRNYICTRREAIRPGTRAVVQYQLGPVRLADIDAVVTAAVAAIRERNSGATKADPCASTRVRPTHAQMQASEAHPCDCEPSDPCANDRPLYIEPCKDRTQVSRLVGAHFSIVDEQDADAFNELFNTWGQPDGERTHAPRSETDRRLANALRIHEGTKPEHIRAAVIATLNKAGTIAAKARGGGAFLGWFQATLPSAVQDAAISEASGRAKVLTARHRAEVSHARATSPVPRPARNATETTRKNVFGGES